MGLARDYADRGRRRLCAPPCAKIGVDVHDDAGRGRADQRRSVGERIGEKGGGRRVVQIDGEASEGVAEIFTGLAHDGGRGDETERVQGDHASIAVGIGDRNRREHAIIVDASCRIADRVGRREREQRVGVIGDARNVSEWIDVPQRPEIMGRRVGELLCGGICVPGRQIGAARRRPPFGLAGELDVSPFLKDRIGGERGENRGDLGRRQRGAIRLSGRRACRQLANRQQRRQIVAAIAVSRFGKKAACRPCGSRTRPVDVRARNRLVGDIVSAGPDDLPDPGRRRSSLKFVVGEQARRAEPLILGRNADNLGDIGGGGRRRAIDVGRPHDVVDGVRVGARETAHVEARLVISQATARSGVQCRLRRRAGATGISDRQSAQNLAVGIGLQGEFMSDAGIACAAFIVQCDQLAGMNEKRSVQIGANLLQADHGEIVFDNAVRVADRPIRIGVEYLHPQDLALEGAKRLPHLERIEAVGHCSVDRSHRLQACRRGWTAQRRFEPILALVLPSDLLRVEEGARVQPGPGQDRRRR